MSNPTKSFDTLAVLSITSGRLLTRPIGPYDNGIGGIYDVLGWMTDDSPFTHQLPRFAGECKPWIYRWYPEIKSMEEQINQRCEAGDMENLCVELITKFGPKIELQKIPKDDHETKDPFDELVVMRGTDEGIEIIEIEDTE